MRRKSLGVFVLQMMGKNLAFGQKQINGFTNRVGWKISLMPWKKMPLGLQSRLLANI